VITALIGLLAGAVTAAVIAAMLRMRLRLPYDLPNARSLHEAPVPRTGGVALMIGLGASCVAAGGAGRDVEAMSLVIAAGLAIPSFIDDYRGLAVRWRLLIHFAAAALFLRAALASQPLWLQMILLVAIVWLTNLYNFMDGSDGLAGGMAVIGFGCYAWAAWRGGDQSLALTCLSVAAAALAFLAFNFHPAKVFLGDVGSVPLGFLSAALGLTGWGRGQWGLWFPVLVFSPFIVDATVTLMRRLARRERVWKAHREHYYQRLVRMGWGHRRTALAEYALMTACAVTAGYALLLSAVAQCAILAGTGAAYAILLAVVAQLEGRAAGRV
jgi:UDP-N-acetylmuramyl pentapeptide phosphotransferase/UDP-N-acetylglucosamine-1-phosphate transferase